RPRALRQAPAGGEGCVLPEQPANGQYHIGGCAPPDCQLKPGDRVDLFALLNFTCAPGHALAGQPTAFCDGRWSPGLPACVPDNTTAFCSPLISSSSDIICTLNDKPVSCGQQVRSNTRATVKCKPFYELPREKKCGVFDFNISKETEDGVEKSIPWYAAIIKKNNQGSWEFVCSASIISPRVLVSVAHCVWKESDKKLVDAKDYGVVIGKYEHGPKELITNAPQQILVDKIYVSDTFRGYARRFEEDISVIVLKDEIVMNEVTHPICIDLEDEYAPYFIPGKQGIVGSWGVPVDETYKLRVISLPVVDFEECLKNIPPEFHSYLTHDKFCGERSICIGDSGVGYANQFKDGKWYLTGIASVGVNPGNGESCEIDFYKGFTRASLFINLIRMGLDSVLQHHSNAHMEHALIRDLNAMERKNVKMDQMKIHHSVKKIYCKLPDHPENGHYTFIGCNTNSQLLPGDLVAPGILLNFSCNPGFVLSGPSFLACYNGWSSMPPFCNPVLCNPLQNPSREVYKCILNREDVDCSTKSVKPGTTATVRCQSNYESIPGLREYNLECQSNGNWNREFHSCVPKCGVPNPRGVQLIALGHQSKVAQFPWHVGFYEHYDGQMRPTCGGSIVSPHVIISAAHCFWRSGTVQFNQFQAVAGKYNYDWNNRIKYVQLLTIKTVILHPKFRGREKHFENDIAIVILKNRILINEAVRPVCLDYENNFLNYFTPGAVGNKPRCVRETVAVATQYDLKMADIT
ncbi:Mannan-binding lectin serine protease 1, partial [Gryllus bimaculatus]